MLKPMGPTVKARIRYLTGLNDSTGTCAICYSVGDQIVGTGDFVDFAATFTRFTITYARAKTYPSAIGVTYTAPAMGAILTPIAVGYFND